jgi:hypothetical protein
METPIRAEKMAMADSRAMDEQNMRTADLRATSGRVKGGAKKKGMMPEAVVMEESSSDEECRGYGKNMSEHIKKQYGERFHKHFLKGMGIVKPVYGNPDIPDVPVSFSSNVPQKSKMTGGMMRMAGAGKLDIEISHDEPKKMKKGGVAVGKLEGDGKPDRRKVRAMALKKIMAEKKLNLVEASKYMKEHNVSY